MSIPKTLAFCLCCALLLSPAAQALPRVLPPLQQAAGPDTTEADEKFDSFLDQLIARIQSNIEQSSDRTASRVEDRFDDEEVEDSVEVITGDMLVAHDEVVDRDLYLKDGTLTVEGTLHGNATVLRGDIRVASGGRITGNAHVINGSVYREPGGVVEGEIHETTSMRGSFFRRYLAKRSADSFEPRWLHENLYVESPIFRYNRVEGVYLGLSSMKKFYWDGRRIISGYGSVGYGFLTHRWRGQLGLDRQFAGSLGLFEFGGEGHNLTDTKDDWIIGQTENTLAAFLVREDYRDLFQRAGFSAHVAWYTKGSPLSTMINAEYRYDDYESLYRNTNWSLFKNKDGFRENPAVNEGLMRSVAVTAGINTVGKAKHLPAGWDAMAQAEFGGRSLGGDFSFTRAILDIRRYQPLSKYDNLNVRIRLGSLEGDAIVQKSFEVGGVNTLPAFGFKEFAGNRMMLGNIEYALNGRVFDNVDFWPGSFTLIVFADAGNAQTVGTDVKVTDGFQEFSVKNLKSDIGFALAWHDGSARLGFAWRTDKGAPPMVFLRLSRPF
ncbi:MAG: BamA/TamA family outer membrane protein [Acidobacteriota bacterium]